MREEDIDRQLTSCACESETEIRRKRRVAKFILQKEKFLFLFCVVGKRRSSPKIAAPLKSLETSSKSES